MLNDCIDSARFKVYCIVNSSGYRTAKMIDVSEKRFAPFFRINMQKTIYNEQAY
jgi:hypothetical protein